MTNTPKRTRRSAQALALADAYDLFLSYGTEYKTFSIMRIGEHGWSAYLHTPNGIVRVNRVKCDTALDAVRNAYEDR